MSYFLYVYSPSKNDDVVRQHNNWEKGEIKSFAFLFSHFEMLLRVEQQYREKQTENTIWWPPQQRSSFNVTIRE